jgi:hypothetical protein
MSKVSIRVGSTKRIPGAKMIATHAHKKREVLALLRKKHSCGWVYRFLEVPEPLVIYWRDEAGIPALAKGNYSPAPSPTPKSKLGEPVK